MSDAWTSEFEAGTDKRRYAHGDIQKALVGETLSKCAYCESRVSHVAWQNIEHITPKSVDADLVCEWRNLTLACPRCNTYKGDYFNTSLRLVDPYDGDVGQHLGWLGPMMTPESNDRGKATITKIRLNRAELLFERTQHFDRVQQMLNTIRANPGPVADAMKVELETHLSDEGEFAAATRAYVESRGFML
ncbi:MAG: hypothetical protein GY788_31650 [bacterium]|nr:hypothetical protein [bacterium]